jgi:predicted GNAT family acetyltransferase
MTEQVSDNTSQSRYELTLAGGIAFIDYTVSGTVRTLTHAEVPPAMRGGGVAARLTSGALELARSQGIKVIPRCPYVVTFIERHPEFQDLLARR